ncbi:MAG TPA: recombinase, partial [Rubrivivax sp.]|nr:recombinase [Rubrivivax sp.]
MSVWDLTALVNAANAKAGQADRNLWLVRLMEWLRHAPRNAVAAAADEARTPLPVLRLRHLLNHLDKNEAARAAVQGMMRAFRRETDAAALYADFGFGSRMSLAGELLTRVQARVLPATPDTRDLAALFRLMFEAADADWIAAIDTATLHRAGSILAPAAEDWRATLLDAITILVSAVHAAGYSPALRQRMDTALLHDEPFRQLTAAAGALRTAVLEGRHAEALQEAAYLRALLDTCRRAAGS